MYKYNDIMITVIMIVTLCNMITVIMITALYSVHVHLGK